MIQIPLVSEIYNLIIMLQDFIILFNYFNVYILYVVYLIS